MKITVVRKISYFGNTKRIDSFHYAMFHGICKRREDPLRWISTVEDPASGPLELIINDYRLNKIIQPGISLVVTKDIASVLGQRFGIRTQSVAIKGVATIEYVEGSMKHWGNPNYKDKGGTPESILRRAAEKLKSGWTGPPLEEVVPHEGEDLAASNRADAFERDVFFPETEDDADVVGTKKGLEDFGVIWSDGVHSFRQDVFDYIEPYLHKDYFAVQKIEV